MTSAASSSSRDLTVLTASDVDTVLAKMDLSLAVAGQAQVFAAYSNKDKKDEAPGVASIQLPLRHVLQTPAQSMLFMPARVPGTTAIKIVSVPKGGSDGLPGTTLVLDEVSGKVRAVINARRLTAVRNAAGSVLSMKILDPEGKKTPQNMVVFGSGAQADSHVRAFVAAYPSIKTVTVVARRSTPRSEALVASLAKAFPAVKVAQGVASFSAGTAEAGFDLSATVHAADIVCTMTSSEQALYGAKDVKAGSHHCLIGSYKPHMREVEDELIQRAGVVLVDSREACGHEAGELQNVTDDDLVEIGEVINSEHGAEAKVNSAGDVNVFKSVGLGVQDVAISALIVQEAERLGLGTIVPNYD